MKVAINCNFFSPKGGGIKEYILNLVLGLKKAKSEDLDVVIYVLSDNFNYAMRELGDTFKIKKTPYTSKQKIRRSIFERKFWLKEEQIEKFDVYHSPFFHSPSFKNAKVVITVHDMRFERYPHTYTKLRYLFLKMVVKRSLKRCDAIISISQFTKDEIVTLYGIDASKITVVWEAIDLSKFSTSNVSAVATSPEVRNIGENFILSVGHLEPRKNYLRLIDAFEKLKSEGRCDGKLVIVGKKSHDYHEVIERIGKNEDIIYLNFVSDEDLFFLYGNARLFVFPSIYEGFGFPPLEAAAMGTVSAVSNVSCIPEICGDGSIYFNPFDVDNIADVIAQLWSDPDLITTLKTKMRENLQRFSWEKNAVETINVYEKVVRIAQK